MWLLGWPYLGLYWRIFCRADFPLKQKITCALIEQLSMFNPNPHCFIVITKVTACGWKEPLLPHPLHSAQPYWGEGEGGCYIYGSEDWLHKNVSYN
jgi:hypothetical protein